MKYFLDTEFHEYKKKPLFGKPINTIELISIGIVSEGSDCKYERPDGKGGCEYPSREYYAICKEFDLKAAWNNEWLRENVLRSINKELYDIEYSIIDSTVIISDQPIEDLNFTFNNLKKLINKYGKTRKQIAEEVKVLIYTPCNRYFKNEYGCWVHQNDLTISIPCNTIEDNTFEGQYVNGVYEYRDDIRSELTFPEFYAYYADYDHVCLVWLYGRMIDLPIGFPKYTKDIQQIIDDNNLNKELLLKEIPQVNCHNSLSDAIWNKKAYNWILKQL